MSRPSTATVDYFPHLVKGGKTIFILESKFKNDGYAVWFKILELLGSSDGHYIDCRDPAAWEFLQAKCFVDEDKLLQIIKTLANLSAIDREMWEHRVIYCQNFINNVAEVYKRRTVALPDRASTIKLLNLPIKDNCQHLSVSTEQNVYINPSEVQNCGDDVDGNLQSKVKESKVNKTIVNQTKEDARARATDDQVVDNLSPGEGNPSSEGEGHGEPDGGSDGELSADENPDFMTFWKEYPKKTDIGLAAKEWTALTNKGFRASDLVLAAKKYTAYLKKHEKEQFTKKAHKFLAEGTYLEYMPKYRPDCPRCRGSGWKEVEVPEGYRGMTRKMVPCDCEIGGNVSA